MTFKLHLPHYFANSLRKEMTQFYAALAIADLALGMVMLFEPIFLYKVLGFKVEEVLLFFACVYGLYIVLIPLGAKFANRFGYKQSILLSIPFIVLYWMCLFASQSNIYFVFLAPLMLALEKAFFWPAFHSIIVDFSNKKQRGREFSIINVIVSFTQILGPFIGGVIAELFGFRTAFVVASLIYCCMYIPLIFHPTTTQRKPYSFRDVLNLYRSNKKKMLGYFGFAEELLVLTIWPIFIFLAIDNYQDTGTFFTVAGIVSTASSLYIGKLTDLYPKRSLIKIGSLIYSGVWVLRVFVSKFFGIFIADTASRSAKDLTFIPLCTVTYERAAVNGELAYSVFFEQSLAIGKFLAALLAALLFALTGSFVVLFILAALCTLLYMLI